MSSASRKLSLLLLMTVYIGCQTTEKMSQQPQKPEGPIVQVADMLESSDVFSKQLTGFALYDPDSDSLLYGKNKDRYFTPASNTKLFTFYTGLKLLPDSLPALEYVIRGDSLIFWGTGDPSFLHPDFGSGKVYEFLKSREERLFYSDSNFEDERMGPGWAWDDYNYYYQTEKTPLPVYGNVVRFEVQEIQLHQIASSEEGLAVSPSFFRDYISMRQDKKSQQPLLKREISGNHIAYKPVADTVTHTVDKPFHYSPQLITGLLSDTLNKPVEYLGEIEKPHATELFYSIASDTAYKRMLQPSDNFIAEQLLLVAAAENGLPLNSDLVIQKMKSEYLNTHLHEPQWVDGSGLSRYNMFTPYSMIELLEQIDQEFEDDEALFELLPSGGQSGTIEDWYAPRDNSSAYVFAKTGTLSNNHSLSGYLVTVSGKKLLFSFMNNHYVGSNSMIKKEMEEVLWFIHKNL